MSNKTYKSDAIQLDQINLDKVNLVCPLEGLSNFRKWVAGYEDRFEHIRDFYQRSDDSATARGDDLMYSLVMEIFDLGYSARQAEIDRGKSITKFAKTMKEAVDAFDKEFGINH